MKHNKLKIYAVLLLGFGLLVTQAQTTLFVKQKVGNNTPFNLSTLKSLTFAGGNLTINKKDASTSSIVRTNVQYINFNQNNITEIIPLNASQNSNLTLFPNPAHDVLNIEISKADLQTMLIEIVGIDDRVALRCVLHNDKSCISVSSLPKGIYLLRCYDGTFVSNLKFIKQ